VLSSLLASLDIFARFYCCYQRFFLEHIKTTSMGDANLPVVEAWRMEEHERANMIAAGWGTTLTHYRVARSALTSLGAR
jgi:hypothetical protein